MSRPRNTPPLSHPSSTECKELNTTANAGPNFFRKPFPTALLESDSALFSFLDLRSKAKLTRTSTLFSTLPRYRAALSDFNKITQDFFKFVQDGNTHKVIMMLNMYPELHFATAKFTDDLTGEEFKRNAHQLALAAEDVGREGCDLKLCLVLGEATSQETLALYSDGNILTPFRYIARGREWTIERGTNPDQLSPAHFATLKAMYDNHSLLQQNLNLSHGALTPVQQQAYSALLKITSGREHTLFVKEDGMVQEIERSFRAQPGGELEITRGTNEQFPEGWEEEERKRAAKELTALEEVAKAINKSRTNTECIGAFQVFRGLVKPCVTKTGKHFNGKLLADALELWEREFWNAIPYDIRKSNVFLDEVFGYIESIPPANYRHAIAQGVQPFLEHGEKLKRSFKVRAGGVSLDGRFGGFWVDIFGQGSASLRSVGGGVALRVFQDYVRAKAASLQNITQPRESRDQKHSRRRCIIQ